LENNQKIYEISDPENIICEDEINYGNSDFILKPETYKIIGACMEVHNELGTGFHEIVYKDALEIEFNIQKIPFEREKMFKLFCKGFDLNRNYKADFLVIDQIILEVKADTAEFKTHSRQVLNYLASSGMKIGLYVNFGSSKLKYNRMIL
jgi:GxxExxY protein